MHMLCKLRQLCLLLVIHPASEENDELRLRHRLHLIEREIRRELRRHLEIEQGKQPPQLLHIFSMHAPAVTEESNGSRLSLCRVHEAVHERTRGIEIPRIVLPIEEAMRRHRHDGNPELRLQLLRDRLRIITDHAADAGVCDEYGLRVILLCGKANALPQPVLAAENRLALAKAARQERHGRETYGGPRCRQPVKTAHIHAVRNMRTRTRAVKDNECTPHEGQRAPDTRHAAAAVRPADADPLDLNPHSAPPDPRVPRTPSASERSASHSYRSPARVPYSAAPAPNQAHRR